LATRLNFRRDSFGQIAWHPLDRRFQAPRFRSHLAAQIVTPHDLIDPSHGRSFVVGHFFTLRKKRGGTAERARVMANPPRRRSTPRSCVAAEDQSGSRRSRCHSCNNSGILEFLAKYQ
jgi:hypothetical protein